MRWAICDHFKDYLYYSPHFQIYTDYNAFTYLTTSCGVTATAQRRITEFANFNFVIHYKPGTDNVVADPLSRMPFDTTMDMHPYSKSISVEEVKATFDGAVNQTHSGESWVRSVNAVSICYVLWEILLFLYLYFIYYILFISQHIFTYVLIDDLLPTDPLIS